MPSPKRIDLQLLKWSDTSNGGMTVTFQIEDDDALEYFKEFTLKKGKVAGQLFATVFQITDAQADEPKKTWNDLGPLCQQAVSLCKDEDFWKFMNKRWEENVASETEAKKLFCRRLSITSRNELDTDLQAGGRFKELVKDFESR